MNIHTAQEIIDNYETSLNKGTIGMTDLRKKSWLIHSKGMIKFAYFNLIEQLIIKNALDDERKSKFVSDYSCLSLFIDDQIAEKYANDYEIWQSKKRNFEINKKDEIFAKQYIAYLHMLKNSGLSEEITDYIDDLKNNNIN